MATAAPVRTCIGCRRRAEAEDLFRVVVAPEMPAGAVTVPVIVPDPRRRMPGRGAWLHPDRACVELARRRRAIGRALKVPGEIDSVAVDEYVSQEQDG